MNAPVKMDGIFTGEHGTASMVGFAVAILATALLSNYWAVQSVPAKKTPPADAPAATAAAAAAAPTAKTTKKTPPADAGAAAAPTAKTTKKRRGEAPSNRQS
jgi:hypothetical protein